MNSAAIRWPAGYSPGESPVHVVNRIDIAAPPSVIWGELIRAGDWPEWYANSRYVVIDGGGATLFEGAQFRWKTFGVALRTRVTEWVPDERIAWLATGIGVRALHAWLILPTAAGCTVVTEETQHGVMARAGAMLMSGRMSHWHQCWLEGLKARAEAAAAG